MMKVLRPLLISGVLTGLLFSAAGRIDLPFVWTYIGVMFCRMLVTDLTIDAGLVKERRHPAHQDEGFALRFMIANLLYLTHLTVAGLDVGRFHWSGFFPPLVQVIGLLGGSGALILAWRAMLANRFFSTAIRIQRERGHYLVTSGPYRYIRHPGYTGALIALFSSPFALGSYWSLIPISLLIILLIIRTLDEDRFLYKELQGYEAYVRDVPYRLIPNIW